MVKRSDRRRAYEAAVALALAALLVRPTCAAPVLNADEKSRLAAGDAIVRVSEDPKGEADAAIVAAIDIAAPPSRVFAVMTDCQRAPTYVKGLKSCRVLSRADEGKSDVREHRSQWASMAPVTVSVFKSTYVQDKEIRFERVRGDLKFLKGAWTLEPRNNGAATRLSYDVRISAAIEVPPFMVRAALMSDVPKLLMSLRNEVLSGK